MDDQRAPSAPSLLEVRGRIENACSDLDSLQGHLLHIADLADNDLGDRNVAQTSYALANAIRAIKSEIDSAVTDLMHIARVRS